MLSRVSEFPSFLRLNNISLYGFASFLLIHSSTSGHLGCFYLLAVANNPVNLGV